METQISINGTYRHYKGNLYRVLYVARDSDSLEETVVYMALYSDPTFGEDTVWVRRSSEFRGTIQYEGKVLSRFTRMPDPD
jgi:hypothetical protein